MTTRIRAWCFTLNNPTERDKRALIALANTSRYVIAQLEHAPTTGTPHYQGYMVFHDGKSFSALHKAMPRAHFEPARGTAQQNYDYCTKAADEGQPPNELVLEHGTLPQQGERVDISQVRELLRSGVTYRELVDMDVNYQVLRIAQEWLRVHEPARDFKPEVRWFYGEPGAGKTRAALEWLESHGEVFTVETPAKYWDGYDGHNCVLFDDLRADQCGFVRMLRLLDRYAMRVEVKGGSKQLRARYIAITAPHRPEEIYRTNSENIVQLTRRISSVTHVIAEYPDERSNTCAHCTNEPSECMCEIHGSDELYDSE